MLAILFPIDVIWLPVSMLLSAIAGFSFRSMQIQKLKRQVSSLEKEMLNSHAEILSLQAEIVRSQTKNPNTKSLVVAMKEVPPTEENKELQTDAPGSRKKVK